MVKRHYRRGGTWEGGKKKKKQKQIRVSHQGGREKKTIVHWGVMAWLGGKGEGVSQKVRQMGTQKIQKK